MHLQVLRPEPLSLRESLEQWTTAQLRDELAELLGMTAGNLLRLAMIVDVLKARGEDLSAINGRFQELLTGIAAGTLLPETVVMFAGNSRMLRMVGSMTLDEQRDIVDGRSVPPTPKPRKERRQQHQESQPPVVIQYEELLKMGPKLGTPKDIGAMAATLLLASSDRKTSLAEFRRIVAEYGLTIS